jgi:hypothetical protein
MAKSEIQKAAESRKRAEKKVLNALNAITPPLTPTGKAADTFRLFQPGIKADTGEIIVMLAKAQLTLEEAALLRDHLAATLPESEYPSDYSKRCADFIERNPGHELSEQFAEHAPRDARRKRASTQKKASKKTAKKA